MRLWHEKLLPKLSRQRLLGQHRECCALRGNGWGKKHSVVDYVFEHPIESLIAYHYKVMNEMYRRKYHVSDEWYRPNYRGKNCDSLQDVNIHEISVLVLSDECVYREHDSEYLEQCINLLRSKGEHI